MSKKVENFLNEYEKLGYFKKKDVTISGKKFRKEQLEFVKNFVDNSSIVEQIEVFQYLENYKKNLEKQTTFRILHVLNK
tara:strand:+ start:461 stop:697 length:237 start_codon:yes stop_codon:yes gene_type:complete